MAKKKKEKEILEFEIQFYEGLLKESPNFIEALTALADLYTRKGLYEEGLKIDEKLYHLKPTDAIVLYNLACSYSLVGEVDKALKTIKLAIDNGYDDFHHLEQDADLENLHKDARFKRYFSKIIKQIQQY